MDIKNYFIYYLKERDLFNISYPINELQLKELKEKLHPLPLIVVNTNLEIISGMEYLFLFKNEDIYGIDVMEIDITDKDALFLAYNLKSRFTGVNSYEKLLFIKKVLTFADPGEIHRRTGIDIAITPDLRKHLRLLTGEKFRDGLATDAFTIKTAIKIANFDEKDRDVLLSVFSKVPFTSSHQQKIIEMSEEIRFRDKQGLTEIFSSLGIGELLENDKPQKEIIERLYTHRFPLYKEAETQWQNEIETLGLPKNIKVTHWPYFEKKSLDISITVEDMAHLKQISEKLKH